MAFTRKDTLEDFAVKSNHLAKMTGVAIAAHAIGDGFMLMHSGVGCKYKAAAQVSRHDLVFHANRKEAWTEISEAALISGSSQRIAPYARQWYDRRRFGFLIIASAYFVELTGEDMRGTVEDLQATLPCPAILVNTVAPNGGLFDGYNTVMYELARRLPWAEGPKAPRHVATAGFFFHRYEADQKADLGVLRQLYKAVGLEDGAILFSGQDHADLARAPDAGTVVKLPYLATHEKKFDRLFKGRRTVNLDLPIGRSGTARFVRELAAAVGFPRDRVDAMLARQVEASGAAMEQVSGFRGLRVALFAETPLAAGLATLFREMGLELALVGLRDDVFGGEPAFRRVLEKNEVELNPDCVVVENPSLRRVRQEVLDRVDRDDVHLVVGSSIDLELFTWAQASRTALRFVPLVETGFPSFHQHAAVPMPTFGFPGALSWAQRLTDAMMQPRLGIPRRSH